ncbi:MAG TPA: 3-hydroxyanthranilate 3,4-dioxygenase [Crocinitomicaceae bacterium]|nr:3-hydroxyanthranilate 3,4-dioxygenase [Crocinitomicaceae bacterium]
MLLPFNIDKWLEDNKDLLKPPVNNKVLFTDTKDFIVMAVGGPNARKDYHFNESEEFFYQLKGDMTVAIQQDGQRKEIQIKEGEMFLLPANIPHNPIRPAETIGLVIERVRTGTDLTDGLMWFCEKCNNKLHEYRFPLSNIEKDFLGRFKEFYASEELRTCKVCNHVMEADERFV